MKKHHTRAFIATGVNDYEIRYNPLGIDIEFVTEEGRIDLYLSDALVGDLCGVLTQYEIEISRKD